MDSSSKKALLITGARQVGKTFAKGIILQNENISVKDKAVYLPVYMTMFIENKQIPEDLVYRVEAI